jgi:hypothetical protein
MKGENMKYLLFIVLLVTIIITAGCVQPGPATSKVTPTPTPTSCENKCNDICYDIVRNDCCGGTIYPHNYNNFKTGFCCGEKWYPTNKTGTCCGGTMYDYKGTCCGDIMYSYNDSKYKTCCGGKLYSYERDYPSQYGWECCSGVWITTETDHCCAGKVEPGKSKNGFWEKCGDSCYDASTQSCCVGGSEDYNPIYSVKQGRRVCCKDTPKLEGYSCNPDSGVVMSTLEISKNCRANTDGSVSCGPAYL